MHGSVSIIFGHPTHSHESVPSPAYKNICTACRGRINITIIFFREFSFWIADQIFDRRVPAAARKHTFLTYLPSINLLLQYFFYQIIRAPETQINFIKIVLTSQSTMQ